MKKDFIKKSFAAHSGSFHADEITACALLIFFKLIDKKKIFRTRDENILKKCEYICDVGGIYDPEKKRFDHHQVEYKGELSSAGMVLKYLKDKKYISKSLYDYLNNFFIKGVDLHDIGKITLEEGVCSFSEIISSFVPLKQDPLQRNLKKPFLKALDFTIEFIKRIVSRFYYLEEVKKTVKAKMKNRSKYLIFKKALSWQEPFFELGGEKHPALFIIMPTGKYWKLRCIPPNFKDRMKVRKALPKKWAGLLDEKLQKASKIKGAIFCHKARFISIWKTKEDAIQALKYVLKRKKL